MSQSCPICRLYNPDSAIRCDCGYDFASGTMKTSLVQASLERKHGRSKLVQAAARQDLLSGISLAVVAVPTVVGTLATGRITPLLPLLLIPPIVLIARAARLRREASSDRR